ncbi:MAG: HDOD domain-containing protein [Pseudomonadales bacterium]|nr:HDOD domain-containing protein [Pseudomonadales bacterium]
MARQPIYDQMSNITAYELLFRQYGEEHALVVDGDAATSEVLVNVFTHFNIDDIVGNKKAYINFTEKLIAEPPPFDKRHFVIEVLEDIEINDSLVANLTSLRQQNYVIALDDFIYNDQSHRILPLADIVKIDVLLLSQKELVEHVIALRKYDLTLLAEKVETREMWEFCLDLGFELFQGYFLSKPEIISGKNIPPSKLLVLELLGKLQNPNITVKELDALICRDPILSFKVLKLVNSASYVPRQKIESLTKAITYLGLDLIRSLASLLSLSNLSDKPNALKDQAVLRARMCEKLGEKVSRGDAAAFFSVGLFSLLDAFFDQPLESVVNALSLNQKLSDALLRHEGFYGEILSTVIHLEKAEFDDINWAYLYEYGISPEFINEVHQETIIWHQSTPH